MQTEYARAKLLLQRAKKDGGWLTSTDNANMLNQLRTLFLGDRTDDQNLLEFEVPRFLNERIRPNAVMLQHTDDDGDPLEEAGFLLSDGDAIPLLKRLRGIRLDVLRELAHWCSADDLVRMIDGEHPAQISPQPASAPQEAPEPVQANQSDKPTIDGDCLPPVTTGELAAAFAGLNGWDEDEWNDRLGAASSKKWMLKARLSDGTRGRNGTPATWNPVILAMVLHKRVPSTGRVFLARFLTRPVLKPWLDQLCYAIPDLIEPA